MPFGRRYVSIGAANGRAPAGAAVKIMTIARPMASAVAWPIPLVLMRSHAGAHGAESQWHGISGHKAACRGRTVSSLFRAKGQFAARRGGRWRHGASSAIQLKIAIESLPKWIRAKRLCRGANSHEGPRAPYYDCGRVLLLRILTRLALRHPSVVTIRLPRHGHVIKPPRHPPPCAEGAHFPPIPAKLEPVRMR
jgi:hypothetical protein